MAEITINEDVEEFEFIQKARRVFSGILQFSQVLEEHLPDAVSAYAPWVALLIPGIIGFQNIQHIDGWGPGEASVYVIGLEFIGISTINTTLKTRAWNIENPDNKAPFGLSITLAICYFVISLFVNIGLERGGVMDFIIKGLISCFSVISSINLSIRSEQAKRVTAAQNAVISAKTSEKENQERADGQKRAEAEKARQWAIEDQERVLKHQEEETARQRAHDLKLAKISASTPATTTPAVQVAENAAQVTQTANEVPATFGKWTRWPQLPDVYKLQVAEIIREKKETDPDGWKLATKETLVKLFGIKDRAAYDWIGYAERDYPTQVSN